ncbi:SpoIIE family protein phosphatase [bacterium]|nr:SpoIIE family protein phosphatase [bacterium]
MSSVPSHNSSRILIIDDDSHVRRLFMQFLQREAYLLDEAASGRQGLEKISENSYDLVITDLQMPEVDGLQILNAARQKDQDVQVLIVTGFGSITTAVYAMKIGACDYLTKPLQSDALLIKVSQALERRRLRSVMREQECRLNEQTRLFQDDMELARQVQASLVPAVFRSAELEVRVHYRPMLGIGGDFADVYEDGHGLVYLSVVDVTGHGIAAALVVNRVYSELRVHVQAGCSPRQILHRLNDFFMQTFTGISLFLTMICVRCDLKKKKLVYAGSAHPAGLLLSTSPPSAATLISQNRILGFSSLPVDQWIEQEIAYTPGDRLILYTDGMVETENSRGEPLALEGLLHIAQTCRSLPAIQATEAMIQQTLDFSNRAPRDDLLLLVADFL